MATPATSPDLVAQAVIDVLSPGGTPVGTIGSLVKRTPDPAAALATPILEVKPVQNAHTRLAAATTKMDQGLLELTYRDRTLAQQQADDPTVTLAAIEDRNWTNRNAILAALDADVKLANGGDPAVSDAASHVEEQWHPDGPFEVWQNAQWVVWHARMTYRGPKLTLPRPLQGGLLAYWRFAEGSGVSVADSGPSGLTGTWGGTLGSQWGTGIIGTGGVFNGTSNVVDAGVQPRLTFAADASFAVSLWAKPSAVSGSASLLVNGLSGTCYNWRLARVGTALDVDNGVASPVQLAAAAFSAGAWTHVVVVYAAGSVRAYVNGVDQGVAALLVTPTCTAQSVKIGSSTTNTAVFDFFAGALDEIGIWGRVLSPAEVPALYNGGAGLAYPF